MKVRVRATKQLPVSPFTEADEVVFTEKIHGTWVCFGWHPDVGKIVNSKGLSAKGLAFKFNEKNESNLYMRALENTRDREGLDIIDRIKSVLEQEGTPHNEITDYTNTAFYVLGEVYGKGVQDLSYGTQQPEVRFFDLHVGDPNQVQENISEYGFISYDPMKEMIERVGGTMTPELYRGPFSEDVMWQYTSGTESVSGNNFNMREGIVIRPTVEAFDAELGRMIAKNVSEEYLLRKSGTEFN